MKKLRKKVNYSEKTVEAFCYCACYCRPYEDRTQERYRSNMYDATMSMG